MRRIVITGASGKIASALIDYYRLQSRRELLLLSSKEILVEEGIAQTHVVRVSPHDIDAYKSVIKDFAPHVIINTVGYTDVDGCESNRALAQLLNSRFPEILARISRTFDVHLVHFSTDYVFDGTSGPYDEAQIPNPINYYGKTKLAGENAIRSSGCSATIIRINVVYGFGGSSKSDFVEWVIRSTVSNIPIRVATDQFSNPTYSGDVALATAMLVERRRTGLYHLGGSDYCSRYEFALSIARIFDLRSDLIVPVKTEQLQQRAPRPLRGGLISLLIQAELGISLSGITEGLTAYRHHLRHGMKN